MKLLLPCLTLSLLSPSLAAADLTVGAPGSGADFTSIQAAVDAAAPGDRVVVDAGQFAGSILIDKSLDLVGAGSQLTTLTPSVAGAAQPSITVAGLGPAGRVRVVGLELVPGAGANGPVHDRGLVVLDCIGAVTFADVEVEFDAPTTAGDPRELVAIDGGTQVLFDRCRLVGPPSTPTSASAGEGLAGLRAVDSRLWINDSTVRAAGGGFSSASGTAGPGGPGLDLIDTELFLGDGSIRGGPGRLQPGAAATAGGPGARLGQGSRLELTGTIALVGGNGVGSGPAAGPGGPGLDLQSGSVAVLSAGSSVMGGPGSPAGSLSVDDGSANLFFTFEPQTSIRVSDTLLAPGGSFTVELRGLAFQNYGVFLGTETVAPLSVPGFAGLALIQPGTAFQLAVVQTNFLGAASPGISVPPNAPPGLRGYLHGVPLGPVIAPSISVPAFVTVR